MTVSLGKHDTPKQQPIAKNHKKYDPGYARFDILKKVHILFQPFPVLIRFLDLG